MPASRVPSPRLVWPCGLAAVAALAMAAPAQEREWLGGGSHIHSPWSAGYDYRTSPPTPIKARDALYSTPRNAAMARRFGLRWMVTTDHGGPNHAKLNLEQAYRELTLSRELVPDVLQFYGLELNMPGMDHHTLIIPRAEDEASVLHEIESRFDANEDWARPPDPRRQSAARRREALAHGQGLERRPVLFANHPARSAGAIGSYGRDEPWELRENNDLAPDVYRGMEGAPGHQAATLTDRNSSVYRGSYWNPGAQTLGGFDQMTAIVGGLWDALLGEGRRFWIVAS
ncbi:MAG: phosphoesterase, partial [Acidobacteria bacterium]|nr:phosphoesterase [Acidobacteriota bacterium]